MRRPQAATEIQISKRRERRQPDAGRQGLERRRLVEHGIERTPTSSALSTPSAISTALIWNTGFMATWLASAVNSTEPVSGHQQQAKHRHPPRRPHDARRRGRRKGAEQPRIHGGDGARKQRQRQDVADVGGRIGPGRLADRRAQPRLLEGDQDLRRLGQHHRSSTVLPSTVMRSARISSFSTVEG